VAFKQSSPPECPLLTQSGRSPGVITGF
jgi:hypothetical protein